MALPNWGSLEKAQDNDQTIDEAIAAAISDHNDDPTAHLGSGQSLEQHKSQDIIDHPAASLVPDKFASSNNFFVIPVNSTDGLNLDNETSFSPGFMAQLISGTPDSGDATCQFFDIPPDDWGYNDGDIVADFNMWSSAPGTSGYSIMDFNFARVRMTAGYYSLGYYDGSWNYSSDIARGSFDVIKFRIFFDASASMLYFYANGELVYSVSYTLDLEDGEFIGKAITNRDTASSVTLQFGNIHFAFDSNAS